MLEGLADAPGRLAAALGDPGAGELFRFGQENAALASSLGAFQTPLLRFSMGETEIGGLIPVNPSGGVLCSNPIGASGLLRFAESAMQVMGKAGEHQVAGARTALGHAYGGGSQYFSMWVVADTPA